MRFLKPDLINRRILLLGAFVILIFSLLICVVLFQLNFFVEEKEWKISTGPDDGTYSNIGKELSIIFNREIHHNTFYPIKSNGSDENFESLKNKDASLAFIQSDTQATSEIKIVSALFTEYLHILVHKKHNNDIKNIEDIPKLSSVSLGQINSGSRIVAKKILNHFELDLDENSIRSIEPNELVSQFKDEKIDAAFILATAGQPLINELIDNADVFLLPIDFQGISGNRAEAFSVLNPRFSVQTIPKGLYGKHPTEPILTLGVKALLVAHQSVSDDLIYQVTDAIFRHRSEISTESGLPLLLSDAYAPHEYFFQYHTGAINYFTRDKPSFLVKYAEVISLLITLLIGFWSLIKLVIRLNMAIKKERIDVFYNKVRKCQRLPADKRVDELNDIHYRAFTELMNEKLEANESFSIFHNYLLHELSMAKEQAKK